VESLLQSLRPPQPSSVRCKRSGLQEK
jgi:hypothetical protein